MKHALSSFIPSFFRPTVGGGAVAPAEVRSKKYEVRTSERSGMNGWLRKAAVLAIVAGACLGVAGEAWAWGSYTSLFNSYIVANGDWLDGSGTGHDDFNGYDFGEITTLKLGGQVGSYFSNDGNNGSQHVHGTSLNYYGRMGWRVRTDNAAATIVAEGTLALPYKNESGSDDIWEELTTCNDVATGLPAGNYKVEVWFYVAAPDGSSAYYDSNNNTNYIAKFQIAGGTAGLEVTGVDSSEYTIRWDDGNKPYRVQYSSDGNTYTTALTSFEFLNSFTSSGEDWVQYTSGDRTLWTNTPHGRWGIGAVRPYTGTTTAGEEGFLYLTAYGSSVTSPCIRGVVITQVVAKIRAAGSAVCRRVRLDVSYDEGSTWTALQEYTATDQNTVQTGTYAPPTGLMNREKGLMFRVFNVAIGTGQTVHLHQLNFYGVVDAGGGAEVTGASGTHCVQEGTRGAAGTLCTATNVVLGTKPGTVTGSSTASGLSFSWGSAGAAATGYIVDATKTAGASGSTTCPDSTLTKYLYGALPASSASWFYYGNGVSGLSGTIVSAPAYYTVSSSKRQALGRDAGLVSPDVALAGAGNVSLSFGVYPQNLGSYCATRDNARVDVWYSIKPSGGSYGAWIHLGTGYPDSTSAGHTYTFNLPKGAYDDPTATVRFMITSPETGYNRNYYRGALLGAVKVTWDGQAGNYASPISGYPKTVAGTSDPATITGLTVGEKVYYKVKALQGSGVRSVWVEGEATLVAQVVAWTAQPTGVAVGETVTVAARGEYENPVIKYSSLDTSIATVDEDTGVVTGQAEGTVTIRATAQATAHYPAGVYAEYTLRVRPARPTVQASLSLDATAGTRTTTAFSLDFTRGGGTGVLILVKAGGWPNDPTDGVGVANVTAGSSALTATSYGDAYAVVNNTYANNTTTHNKPVTGATAATHYHARAFTYNNSGSGNASDVTYTYMTPGAGCDFWTLATEPGTAATVSGAKAAVDGDTHAVITYNAQGAGNILLVMMKEADTVAPPVVDGVCYTNVASTNYGTSTAALGAGTIVYAGPAAAGSQTVAVAGLNGGTSYVVYAFPYNTAAGDDGGTSANYRAHTLSAAFETEAAQGPEELDAETTRYTMSVSWKEMTPPAGKTVTGYTVEATACGGDGAVSTLSPTCPDNANLASTYDPTKATHGSTTAWSYRLSVKSASDDTHSYPGWNVNGQQGHELIGRWQTTANKPGIESPVIDLSGAASAKVQFDLKKYNSGTSTTYDDRTRVTLRYSTDGGDTWHDGPTSGNAPASFTTTNLAVPAEALTDNVKLMLFAASTAGYSQDNASKVIGPVVKGISVIQTAKATGDYTGSGCPVPAASIRVEGTNATVTGLSSNQLYYYRVKANYSDSTSSKWSEGAATTKGTMTAPGAGASAERYAGTVIWTAPAGESASTVREWTVEVTGCTSGAADEPTTNACPSGGLTYATSPADDVWTYTNRAGGYPSWDTYQGYNGGAHVLIGTTDNTYTPKGIVTPSLNLSGMGSASVRFMHAPTTQNPIRRSYITLYYSFDGTSWTKATTLEDAGQVYPSLVYKELAINLPDAALAEGVYLKLSADSAYKEVKETATNWYGARLAEIRVVATPLRQDWDFTCASKQTCTVAAGESGFDWEGMSHRFTGLTNATAYGYRVWATDEGGNASESATGQFTTLAGQDPPLQIWADPVKQTQMKLQWDAATASYSASDAATGASAAGLYEWNGGAYVLTSDATVQAGKTYYEKSGTDATGYEIQMTKCHETPWERVVATACPTNRRLGGEDDWSYIGGGTDVDAMYAADGTTKLKESETNIITAGGFYPTWAGKSENSQVLAGEGEPGIMSAAFSTVGATNGVLTFNYGRWYAKDTAANVSQEVRRNASVLTVSYSLDDGASWVEWFKTPSAYNCNYTYGATCGKATNSLPAAALGRENVRVKIVAENAGIMDVSTTAGTSTVTNHAVGAAVALAEVKLQGVSGDYSGAVPGSCRVDDGTWTLAASAEDPSFLVTGLSADTQYYFRVRATDGATDPEQYGAWTDGAAATLAAPDKVTNLTASAKGRYGFTLGWDASARAESYVAYVYSNSACSTLHGFYPAEGLSARVVGLQADTTYYCKVVAVADGAEWEVSRSDRFDVTTEDAISIAGLAATEINTNSMTVVWEGAGQGVNAANILAWGEVGSDAGLGAVEEIIACPASTLARSDSGNRWFYMGGSASYPAYWKGSASGDEGHALIYTYGGTPAIRSRWFDTWGATNVVVEFLHGRFNSGADATVELDYSIDGGATWTYAGEAPSTTSNTPVVARSLALPKSALNRRSVMIQLSAPGADGNKGAHLKDIRLRIQGRMQASGNSQDVGPATSWTLSGLKPATRYWFKLRATDDGTTWVEATNTASTYAETAGVLASQGFEDLPTDRTPWTYTLSTNKVSDGTAATGSGCPVVEVVENENPLYGRKALRMSGSAGATAFGVADFTFNALGGRGGTVTIPFAAKDLAKNDYLYVAYKVDGGSWVAPGGTNQTSMGGIPLTRIGCGGSDVINQNWPYNRVLNATTRPKGDAYVFEVPAGSTLTVRVAFCGQTGGAKRYYYLDELTLEELAGTPPYAKATANDHGTIDLEWTAPAGQSVVIIRGQDKRDPPSTGAPDLTSLPEGYEIVMNGDSWYWNRSGGTGTGDGTSVTTAEDTGATSGWKYFYYFYAVTDSGTIGKTPATAHAIVKGMVKAIASQGWDGWDVHPWNYKQGRVSNPGAKSDCGWWKWKGMNFSNVAFYEDAGEYDDDGTSRPVCGQGGLSGFGTAPTYASIYGTGKKYGPATETDPDATKQQGVSTYTNYYGEHSYRFSGGGGYVWKGEHSYSDWNNNWVTATNPVINTNNVALQFDNVDLTGYKNVEFQMHYAGPLQGGGNYLHLAISTNGGAEGTWQAVDNLSSAGWRVKTQAQDYGLQVQEMYSGLTSTNVDFYDQTLAQYGNPFILEVPDNVTQFMARVMFYDSNGRIAGHWRNASIFIDEVRLLGEVALGTPQPWIREIGTNAFNAIWTNVPGADRYNVRVTSVASNEAFKLTEAFPVQGTLDWTATGSVSYSYEANRQGGTGSLGYGLVLDAGEALASAPIGCAETVSYWAKGGSFAVQIGSGDHWETITNVTAAGSWTAYTNALPHRQWQTLRFLGSSGTVWVDDIEVLGAGNYATTVFAANGVTGTNCPVSGLANGTRYFVSVQAVADVSDGGASYEITSPWGETADYTAGEFRAEGDGFEMVRMGWGNGQLVVIAVEKGFDTALVKAPTNASYTAGAAYTDGGSTHAWVVTNASAAVAGTGFEHVSAYDSAHPAADFVAYWKHGSYWEGRLETNVALGTYVCQAADAMACTNGTFMAGNTDCSSPAATPFGGGTGWDGNWQLSVTHGQSWHAVEAVKDGTPEGLLETNQLWGAGGNMLKFMPGGENNGKQVALRRKLATPLPAASNWWGLFAMKVSAMNDHSWAGMRFLGESKAEKASVGKVWNNNSGGQSSAGIGDATAYVVNPDVTYLFVFKWDGAQQKMSLFVTNVPNASAPAWDPSSPGDLDAPEHWSWTVADKAVSGMEAIHYIELVAQNSGDGHVGDTWFDEVRIGANWPELIGKQELPPLPAYDVLAIPDGNEMVRLSWKYRDAGIEADGTTLNPLREHANGVTVIETTDTNGVTRAEIDALRDAGLGEKYGNATVIASHAVAAETTGGEMDHVVMPGTTHRYAVVARNGHSCADPAESEAVEMGTYGEREWVNPFSYTNGVEFAEAYPANWATYYTGVWKGGHGFESSALAQHYWAKGGAGEWTPVKPSVADAAVHITNGIANYWPSAGNVMKFVPGDQTSGYLKRNLNAAWCGNNNDTFYVAFRMAYQYDDPSVSKWAGLRVLDNNTSDGPHSVLFGKVGGYVDRLGMALVPWGSNTEESHATSTAATLDDFGNSADKDNAYLVVGKVQWTAEPGKANVWVWAAKTGAGGASLPTAEPSWAVEYLGVKLKNVNQIQLEAGSAGGGDIGEVYFDEIRFGTTWDDILGPADPTDVRMALLDGESDSETPGSTAWKGDFVSFAFESQPDGTKQKAAGWLSRSNSAASTWDAWTEAAAATNTGTVGTWKQWNATNVQLTAAGHVRAGGNVTGSTLTMNSWERAGENQRWRLYTVKPLSPPTGIHANGGVLRNLFDWTQWTDGAPARTFEQVMVVRFANGTDRAAWAPEDGTAYAQGATYGNGKIVYVGTETNCVDTGLARNETYCYAFYTVNNDHYSLAAAADCRTLDEDPSVPTVDGDPTDWVGIPSEVKNSSTVSANEFIWTDKVGEERKDSGACVSADIAEFRVKADAENVYFLLRLTGGEGTSASNTYAAVALTTSGLATGNADGEKWIGVPGNTLMGGAYWQTNASLHYADREMAVHWVEGTNSWQVEIWDKNGGHWYAATNWAAAASAPGAADACIEWRVPRDTLGLSWTAANCMTGRFTVATFLNSGAWNNQGAGTVQVGDNGKCRAVDAMAIAPYGQNDKNLALGAWEEGLREKEVPFWADVRFDSASVLANAAPSTPAGGTPDGESTASPWMRWNASADTDPAPRAGFVTGYFLEVSTNATYNGVGDGTENGPIACRVNLEGANTTSNRFITEAAEYWWRVRARDNSGELSAPGGWHYVVTGKKDNTGPVAKLLYVGTNVMQFLEDPAYRADEERSGDATSVLDSELEDGGHNFGFVIEWYDASGVYARNQMRPWDGRCDPEGRWPAGKYPGDFAWNTLSDTGSGDSFHPYGRVSPNWDLMIVDRWSTTQPADEVVDGIHHSYTNGTLTLPTEDGGTEEVSCWSIDCGKDAVFRENEMYFNGNTGLYLTNYVTNAFQISTYRPGIELYLTVSAEDSCTQGEGVDDSGDAGWWPWPYVSQGNWGSYKSMAWGESDPFTSGWCADGPHKARNVTTNQLLKFYVRDNDVIPPVASTEKWKDTATNAARTAFYPFMAAAIGASGSAPSGWDPTWANLEGIGLLPVVEGIGRGATYRLTDEDLAASGRKLRFFFNVYDEYIHSGVKRGTGDPGETVNKVSPPSDRYLTNSAFFVRTWNATADGGAGAWVDGPSTNRANFAGNWSKIYNLDEVGTEFVEEPGEAGTGPKTVLAWEFDASIDTATNLFGMAGILDYIGTHAEGVTNKLMLEAWDSDNNGEGDQAHDNVEFGRLVFRDDDTTPPTAPGAVTVKVDGTAMTAENPIWTNQITSISLSFDAASDPDTVEGGMHENDTHGSGVAAYRVARTDATGVGVGTQVTTSGTETLSVTLADGAAISEGLAMNYLFAVDSDADRDGDALAGEAVGFVTAYDVTPPTSVKANSFTADSSDREDPTSMMLLAWEEPDGGMGPDSGSVGINAYSPWETYKIYFTNFVPMSGEATWNDDTIQALSNGFTINRARWMNATFASNAAYGDLNKADSTNVTLRELEPGENYLFAIVGLDKAGNESVVPRFALGDTIKFMVTQGVIRAWGELAGELNAESLGGEGTFAPVNTDGTRGTPTLYWDARVSTNTHRTSRGYSLVYRDGMGFDEGTNLTTRSGRHGWGDIAGSSISNNFYAEPDGNAQRLGRGWMRFYRATYAGREFKTDTVTPLASEEVYALHNVKLSEGRNYVALHGVPYTNTFRGVFGTNTNIWPSASSEGSATRVEFFDGLRGTDTTASETYWFCNDGKWYKSGGGTTNYTDWPGDAQTNFFTRGFAIVLPSSASGFYNAGETVTVAERVTVTNGGKVTTNLVSRDVGVFDWAPVLQMPTNGGFSVTVNCGTHTTFGKMVVPTGVDTFVAFRAPRILHPRELQLPLVISTDTTKTGFVYNTSNPLEGDRLLIRAAAAKTDRAKDDDSVYGNEAGTGSPTEMYYDGTNWRWNKGSVNTNNPIVSDNVYPIKPNDALVIRSLNGGVGNTWTWTYNPTTLYPAADRHFGW